MVRGSWKFLFIFLLPVIFDGTVMSSSWDQILDRQKIISHIIQETLKDLKLASLHHHNIPDDESIRQPFCMNNDYHNLSVCCSSKDLSNLFNVKIEKGKFIGYSSRPSQPIRLPPIMSLQYNSQPRYSNSFTVHNGTFSPQQCVKYFNGTLHVMAEETVHKLYHAITDNYIPLVSHILMDAWLNHDYLHLPRMVLRVNPKPHNEVRHMKLFYDILSGGVSTIMEIEGWCFRRVVWGVGAHVFRFINPVALRRLTAKFARTHTQLLYPTSIPRFESPNPLSVDDLIRTKYPTFASSFRFDTASKLRTVVTEFKKRHSHSPRVALYSRGESGLGRTIAKENLLLEFLRHLGMETYYFCENCGTMELQIAVASIADIIIGLHGAALVYTIFGKKNVMTLEMKSLYAYKSYLFPLVSDGVKGIHILVDTRVYHSPFAGQQITPGMRMIAEVDVPLLNRIFHSLVNSFELISSRNVSRVIHVNQSHEDYVFGYSPLYESGDSYVNHILGPPIGSMKACLSLPLVQIQRILTKKNDSEVCRDCLLFTYPTFSRRLRSYDSNSLEIDEIE